MAKAYGNLINRIEEGRQLTPLSVGTDITMYHWSDRTCYFISEVIDDKHIKVLPYHVCADHSKNIGQGHQDWLYFKTAKEERQYLETVFPDRNFNSALCKEATPIEWAFFRGEWRRAFRYTKDSILKHCEETSNSYERFCSMFTETQRKKLAAGKEIILYDKLSGKISFGVRDYYYDWEF